MRTCRPRERAVLLVLLLTSCRNAAPARPVAVPPAAAPDTRDVPAALRGYFDAIHRQLAPRWTGEVVARAEAWLPPSHPANDPRRMTEVRVELDIVGQPRLLRVSRGSGYEPFDASALQAMASLRTFPAPPPHLRGIAVVHWRFHRDARGCSPRWARLDMRPFTPHESLQLALARGDLRQAEQLLREHPADARLVALVAEAGLATARPELHRLALPLASSGRVEELLRRSEVSPAVWKVGLAVLISRGEQAALLELLGQRRSLPATGADGDRLLELLSALRSCQGRLPGPQLRALLADDDARVMLAAAALAPAAALLDTPLRRWRHRPDVTGPLSVRRFQLGGAGALEVIRRALTGAGARATLAVLREDFLPDLEPEIRALAQQARAPRAVRVAALELLAGRGLVVPLYLALRERDPALQIAAARALGAARGNQLALSYRLAEVAFKASGELAAEALASLVRVGDERFRGDTLRHLRRLRPLDQARVVAWLWRYGDGVVPLLTGLLEHPVTALREAARRSLSRLPAGRTLAGPPAGRLVRDPLEALLLRAAALRSTTGAERGERASVEPLAGS